MATVKQQIQQGIRDMLLHYTTCGLKSVICGYNNRVPLPGNNDYIIFTVLNPRRYGTPKVRLCNGKNISSQTYRVEVQIDFYGDFAFDRACDIVNISRTMFLCDFLKPYGIQPIACDEAQNLTGISGENEYVERWMVRFEIDYECAVTDSQDYFTTAELYRIRTEL